MANIFNTYIQNLPAWQWDPLTIIGLMFVLGNLAFYVAEKVKIPTVVAYILLGLILGRSFLNIISPQIYDQVQIITILALAMVGFSIGGEMKLDEIRQLGNSVFIITVLEALVAFLAVLAGIYLITKNLVLALLLGALASATAPAAIVSVVWQYGATGPLTITVLAVVGLDDAASMMIYSFASSYSKAAMSGSGNLSIARMIWDPLVNIGGSMLVGAVLGYILHLILQRRFMRSENIMLAVLSILLVCAGISSMLGFSMILSSMALGVVITNLSPKNRVAFDAINVISNPLVVLLFVIVGADLDISALPALKGVGLVYILTRLMGKVGGASFGAWISKAKPQVQKYIGYGLLPQAGVAIGLAMEISQQFSAFGPKGQQIGSTVMTVMVSTVFFFDLLGPILAKIAIFGAGEVNPKFLKPGEKTG